MIVRRGSVVVVVVEAEEGACVVAVLPVVPDGAAVEAVDPLVDAGVEEALDASWFPLVELVAFIVVVAALRVVDDFRVVVVVIGGAVTGVTGVFSTNAE